MISAKELYDAGQLHAAIQAVTNEVKAAPTDVSKRTFLFGLLSLAGEWERAEKQLDVIGAQDIKAEMGVQIFRNNITAERQRAAVFSQGGLPKFFVEPPAYVSLHVSALQALQAGDFATAREQLDRAEEERPAFPVQWNGEEHGDFRDADDWVAPVLELIVQDRYLWLPYEHIQRIEIQPPSKLSDLVWIQSKVIAKPVAGGFSGEGFIPARYIGSDKHTNELVSLGRMTDWSAYNEDLARGAGLRLFLVGEQDKTIFETQTVEFGN